MLKIAQGHITVKKFTTNAVLRSKCWLPLSHFMLIYGQIWNYNQSPFSTIHNFIACRDAGVQDRVVINWKESGFVGWDDLEQQGSRGFICQYKGKYAILYISYLSWHVMHVFSLFKRDLHERLWAGVCVQISRCSRTIGGGHSCWVDGGRGLNNICWEKERK